MTSIYENMALHCTVLPYLESNAIKQLDFLSFYVSADSMALYSPFEISLERDNPNWIRTEYEGVYKFMDGENKLIYQYVIDGRSPVAIMQWQEMKFKSGTKWRCSIYGKALKLYYSGFLDWLPAFVERYQDVDSCCRADICYDMKDRINTECIDLKCTSVHCKGEDNWSYKGFGNKKSDLFIRVYDKTLDLKDGKNEFARLYPSWYVQQCWRTEFKLAGRYSKSKSPLEWLLDFNRDGDLSVVEKDSRNWLGSALYDLLQAVDLYVPDGGERFKIFSKVRDIVIGKLAKFKDLSINGLENEE